MSVSIVASIIGFLSGVVSLGIHVWTYFSDRSKNKAGADAQTARDVSTARRAETLIAASEADAPKSDADVDARLKAGTL